MKYVFAVLFPPLALVLSGKPIQSMISLGLLVVAVSTWTLGIGAMLQTLLVLWAMRIVCETTVHAHVQNRMASWQKPPVGRLS